jgi:hypothetical protein
LEEHADRAMKVLEMRQYKWILPASIGALFFALCALSLAQTPSVSPVVSGSCPTTSMNVSAGKNVPFRDDGKRECHECNLTQLLRIALLEGTVFDQAGVPAPNVQVVIESKPMGRTFTTRTGDKGRYAYEGLPQGEHTLCVAFENKLGLSRLLSLKGGRLFISDFDLKFFEGAK